MSTTIQVEENLIIDTDEIAMCKRIIRRKVGESGMLTKETETGVEIVLRGDKQIYQYWGMPGNIIWSIKKDAAFPAYAMEEYHEQRPA